MSKGPYEVHLNKRGYVHTFNSLREIRRAFRGRGVRLGRAWRSAYSPFSDSYTWTGLWRGGVRIGSIRTDNRAWRPSGKQIVSIRDAARKTLDAINKRLSEDPKELGPWEPYGGQAGFQRYSTGKGWDQVSVNGRADTYPNRPNPVVYGFIHLHSIIERIEAPSVQEAQATVDARCVELGWRVLDASPEAT